MESIKQNIAKIYSYELFVKRNLSFIRRLERLDCPLNHIKRM